MNDFDLQPARVVGWDDILERYRSPAEALAAGAHYIALRLAHEAQDAERFAASLILCGWPERGLARLGPQEITDPLTYLHQAYGFWAVGDTDEALRSLESVSSEKAEALRRLITRPSIPVLVIAGSHTRNGVPPSHLPPFEIRSCIVGEGEDAPPLVEILADGFKPELVVLLDVYGARVPAGVFDAGIPVVVFSYDADYMMAAQTDDLARASLIVSVYAEEHDTLTRIHGARTVQFLTHDVHTDADRHRSHAPSDDYDILHTGRSFTPLHRGKAQYLFALASLDDPESRIRIEDVFYSFRSYRDGLTRARFVAIHERWRGGLQTRMVDALACGAVPMLSDDAAATLFLDELGASYVFARDFAPAMSVTHRSDCAQNLREAFPTSPVRELRFLKLCAYQLLFAPAGRSPSRRPKGDPAHSRAYATARSLVERFLKTPLDASVRHDCRRALDEALATFPDSVPLRFIRARFLWALGERERACDDFASLAKDNAGGRFDPTREEIRLAFFRSPEELTPYDDFVRWLWHDMREGELALPGARGVIAATAHCYLGLAELQAGSFDKGVSALETALRIYPDHFAAARLLAKALVASGRPPAQILAAIERAVALYGPALSELLPYALAAAEDDDTALRWARRWCHFIVRVKWARPEDHVVPEATWQSIEPFLDRLAPGLAAAVRRCRGSS